MCFRNLSSEQALVAVVLVDSVEIFHVSRSATGGVCLRDWDSIDFGGTVADFVAGGNAVVVGQRDGTVKYRTVALGEVLKLPLKATIA